MRNLKTIVTTATFEAAKAVLNENSRNENTSNPSSRPSSSRSQFINQFNSQNQIKIRTFEARCKINKLIEQCQTIEDEGKKEDLDYKIECE